MQGNWYDPWFTGFSGNDLLIYLWWGFVVGFVIAVLLENDRYKQVLRFLAKALFMLIVFMETVVDTIKELPARFNERVRQEIK